MRKIYFISVLMLIAFNCLNAQTPQAINYQGVARDNSGNVIATHMVSLRLSILSGSTAGSAVYVEKHTRTTDAFGLFSLQIGQGTVVSGLFSSISWGNNSYYLKVEIDPTGGINYQLAGVSQFAAVPYAMYATSSGSQTQGSTPGDLQYWNGNAWVVLSPGTTGQILTINSFNMPVWQNAPSYSTNLPLLTTTSVSSILNTTAISGGIITSDGGSVVSERGVCWSIGSTPTISDNKTSDGVGGGSFISNINNLLGSTNYNLRAYATNNSGTGYGMTLSFTTSPPVAPVLTTTTISNITSTSAKSGGNISTNGGALITARGVCWSTSSNPTITGNKTTDNIGSGVFNSDLTGLLPGYTYYLRAYATNNVGTTYGNELNFTTPPVLPILTTTTVSSITSTNALIGGNISYSGGATITNRGICYSLSPNTACYSSTYNGSGTGSFTGSLTQLEGGTTYYVKAYATNSAGTAYGNELSFTTLPPTLPTITTTNVSSIASNVALSGGNISSDGGAYIISSGVCWSTSVNPTIANSKTIDAGTGFTSLINGLTLGTTYYVRAYATNSVGTAYGNQLSFTTMTQIGIGDSYQGGKIAYILQPGDPGYIPGQIRGLIAAPSDQSTSAIWGCNNNNIAGADGIAIGTGNQNTIDIMAGCSTAGIAARLCGDLVIGAYSDWYLPSKDELNKFFINKDVIGGYNSQYWSSSEYDYNYAWAQNWDYQSYSNKTYMKYVRAFRSFGPSVITTTAVSSIESTSVVSGGTISSDGGETVTARGVCWNTSTNPTIALSTKTSNGSGTGSFTSSIAGLTAGTTYYIRAYATNSLGTSYGNEVSFTTLIVLPTITTTAATDITSTTASSGGNITYNGGATITARGICYSTTPNPTIADSIIDGGAGMGSFISNLSGLSMGTTYYIRAYATNSLGTAYGNELSVTTLIVLPTITTTDATNITFSTAISGGNVTSSGGATITARGICYSYTNTNPTTANGIILSGTGTGAFVSNLSGLIAGKTYYVRAYATNSVGTAYGNLISFTTLTVIPIITTTTTTAITSTTATSGGNISNDGGATVTVRGICYSTITNPTIGNSYILNGSGTGSFTSNLTGLTNGTTYYIRAFAINSLGTAYGNEVSFTTLTVLPTITTSVATSITSATASSGGNVTNSGGATITAKGVCWSTSSNPSTALSTKTSDGSGMGVFNSSITGLTAATIYYARAYAINSIGTAYGNEVSFTTLAVLPTITTTTTSSITTTSAISGGNITYNGGANITVSGICWSTSSNPTTALSTKTTDGSVTGIYSSSITGLIPATTYYVRAYATNSVGTSYGNEESFTTLAVLPTITTTAATAITSATASSGGNVTNNGGATITAKGVCWSTSSNPSTALSTKTSDGSGTGVFNSSITGLTEATTYYIRAYATNSVGTSYGNEVSFTTLAVLPTITTTAANAITSTTASSGGNITSDGGASVTSRGICYSTTTNPTTANSIIIAGGSGTGSFISNLTGLTSGTTYYVRAFATNTVGTSYGNQISFTAVAGLPTITTTAASSVTSSTASSGGNITSSGGASITARGICYSYTNTNPTTANGIILSGSGTGIFDSNLSGLTAGRTYYVRAYATNSMGTAYGNMISFTTLSIIPTITTTVATAITSNSALSGGNITNDGGATVTARGICYSTTINPTIANSIIAGGTGSGSFASNLTGLITGTTYYIRAFATNSVGTAYGNMISITTLALPTITTTTVTSITSTTALSGGNITNDGGATVTARGICYSTTTNPTTANSIIAGGTGSGSFISNLTGLTSGTTYYIRAFATNSVGISYGNQISFITLALPTITTTAATALTSTTASSGGNITNDGGATVTARGICYSTTANPTTANSIIAGGTGSGSYISNLTGLTSGTTYYLRAYATNSVGTAYGTQITITTLSIATITTTAATAITSTTASSGGNITNDGGATVTARGICYSTTSNPTTANSIIAGGSGNGSFASNLTGLTSGTTYYIRAFATNSVGTVYGTQITITTLSVPTISTTAATAITSTTASSGGNITNDGGVTVTARGICYSTTANPTTANSIIAGGTGSGSFTSNLTGLTTGTTYYIRAYATNSVGTAYGTQITITTLSLPTIITTAATAITSTSALSGGNITNDGGATVTARGICYSTTSNPTTANSIIAGGSGNGSFASNLTGLTSGTTYYIRSFATNTVGTSYGNQISFTTLALPTITTTVASAITSTTASSGGNITNDGGATVTARGICYSTTTNPTTANSIIAGGSGNGSFASNLTGLTSGTTYYIRAFATNTVGTSYGNQISFTTHALPTITTTAATALTSSTASSGGNITNDGGFTVTARGICYSTTTNPSTANSIIAGGSGIGSFTSNLTGLTSGKTYYLRAYATSSAGTSYGNEISFTTILQDFDGNVYDLVTIGTQTWMKQNLKTTHYKNGTTIPNVTSNSAWNVLTSGAYCDYDNTPVNSLTYGRLYNWYAVNTGNLCPTGWHLPTDAEWTTFTTYLGGESIAGGKLKEAGLAHWNSPNTEATNETGFTALPGGLRGNYAYYTNIGDNGFWWSSSESSTLSAWFRYVAYGSSGVARSAGGKESGFSVRCLRD
jgi:uncharacterized protein (TIGR02145 family)